MTKRRDRSAAIVTIHKPGKMSRSGREAIAGWLRQQATHLVRHGHQYTDTGPFRARYLFLLPLALLLAACATGQPSPVPAPGTAEVAPAAPAEENPFDLLRTNPLLTSALADSDRTLAWIDARVKAGKMSPLEELSARTCPVAVKAAVADLRAKLTLLESRLTALKNRVEDVPGGPSLLYRLTVLKYGDGVDLRGEADLIRGDIALRLEVLVGGCGRLLPVKQMAEIMRLAARAGILTTPAGPIVHLLR